MIELYIIYNTTTGYIQRSGKVNRTRDQEWITGGDTSTVYSSILSYLSEHLDCNVEYKLNQLFPNIETKRLDTTTKEIIDKTEDNLAQEQLDRDIAAKEAEIARLQAIISATTDLAQAQADLAALQA